MRYPSPIFVPPYLEFLDSPPSIPKFYWDVKDQEERFHKLCCELHKLVEYSNMLGAAINLDHEIIEKLESDFEKFMESGFDDYYREQIEAWINEHFAEIVSFGLRQVFFGLTDDGYFCAYVPNSWDEIEFDTGAVFGRSDYGRLILRFEADERNVINNVYESSYSNAQLNAANRQFGALVDELIADLEATTRRGDESYAALFTNMDEVIDHELGN